MTATLAPAKKSPRDRRPDGRGGLVAEGIRVHFAGVKAVDGVDLRLGREEILGLIGPNGSGKTTCINALTGAVRAEGSVSLDGTDVVAWEPQRRARAGLVRTFQGARLFSDLSVEENVEVSGLAIGLSRREARRQTWSILEEVGLAALAPTPASALPAGEVRRVGIARAIATRPRYLLLDEPAAGLNDRESADLVETIRSIRDDYHCGVLLVDHDMRVIMGSCSRLQVLDTGRTIAEGAPEEVSTDAAVVTAYFGESGA